MTLTKTQAALIGIAIVIGAYLYYVMMVRFLEKNEIGGVFLWAFLGCMTVAVLLFSAWDLFKQYKVWRRNQCKYGNVKAGDCISGGKYGN